MGYNLYMLFDIIHMGLLWLIKQQKPLDLQIFFSYREIELFENFLIAYPLYVLIFSLMLT